MESPGVGEAAPLRFKPALPDDGLSDDDALAALLALLCRELRKWKDRAVSAADYDFALQLRDLDDAARKLLPRMCSRQPEPDAAQSGGADAPPATGPTPPAEPPKEPPPPA
jgi:hypothetical protein